MFSLCQHPYPSLDPGMRKRRDDSPAEAVCCLTPPLPPSYDSRGWHDVKNQESMLLDKRHGLSEILNPLFFPSFFPNPV